MPPVRTDGAWYKYDCRECGHHGERLSDSLESIQQAVSKQSLKCGACGSTLLNLYVPGPFPQRVVDAMKRAADEGAIVTGMEED